MDNQPNPLKKSLGAPKWKPPEYFEEYRLRRRVGRGGFGEVYLGHDLLLDRPIAVKFISTLQPDSRMRDRFLSEARAAARLQHPNVVSIYRVGEVSGHLFIVSEYLRGKSLAALPKPMPWQRVLEIGVALTRGLAAAHRAGVLHRDLKPANAALTHDGEAKLLDFGIAKLLGGSDSQEILEEDPISEDSLSPLPGEDDPSGSSDSLYVPSGLAGTPVYMAPEVLQGEPASRRSDVYAMGILMFELCTGTQPVRLLIEQQNNLLQQTVEGAASALAATGQLVHEQSTLGWLKQVVTKNDAPPLSSRCPDADPQFGAIIDRCLRRNPAERFAGADELREVMEALLQPSRALELPPGNPYRGLRPFEPQHRALFFGRKAEIGTVVDRLRTEPLLVVTADSGIGKSSLCRAGVIPLVLSGGLMLNRSYQLITLVPGRHPLQALAEALAPVFETSETALLKELSEEPMNQPRRLRRILGKERGLLIFFDQMEELVTVSDPAESAALTELISALLLTGEGLRLLATVRSDFLARVATLPGLGDDFLRHIYLLRAIGPEKLREAIVDPARLKGVTFESESLVNEMVASAAQADGALPLLQFALAELWETRQSDRITAACLASMGGVSGALARHADLVLASMPVEKRASARRILLSLVTLSGTRARRTEAELTLSDAHAAVALEALVKGRLLIASDTPEGPAYEVVHEALISGWRTLHNWLEESAEARAVKQRLELAAIDWQRRGKPDDQLWTAGQLVETRLLEPHDIGPREAEFLAMSKRTANLRRRIQQALVACLPVLCLLVYGMVKLLAARELERRVATTLSEAQQLVKSAHDKDREATAARRSSFALFDQMKSSTGEETWALSRRRAEDADRGYGLAAGKLEAALSLDSDRQDARALLCDVIYARAVIAEQESSDVLLRDLLQRLELYDVDGTRRAKWNAPGQLSIDSAPQGAQVLIERFVDDEQGRRIAQEPRALGVAPLSAITLPQGSYLLTLRASGRVEVKYPVVVGRGEALKVRVPMPPLGAIPKGFAYVPPGQFLFGYGGEETLRQKFFNTVPQHNVFTQGYAIAIHETTFAEYIEFLNTLPQAQKQLRRSRVASSNQASGTMELIQMDDGRWELRFQPGKQLHSAVAGTKIVYKDRATHTAQDWLRFPVSGVSLADGKAYAAWLNDTGKLTGARTCTELEWERAARGADDREYPNGNRLDPQDTNIDQTYGRNPENFGPDEVGSHPGSRSPFGVHDLAGNSVEFLRSSLSINEAVGRGGGYSWDLLATRSVNRNPVDENYSQADSGFRLCISLPQDFGD